MSPLHSTCATLASQSKVVRTKKEPPGWWHTPPFPSAILLSWVWVCGRCLNLATGLARRGHLEGRNKVIAPHWIPFFCATVPFENQLRLMAVLLVVTYFSLAALTLAYSKKCCSIFSFFLINSFSACLGGMQVGHLKISSCCLICPKTNLAGMGCYFRPSWKCRFTVQLGNGLEINRSSELLLRLVPNSLISRTGRNLALYIYCGNWAIGLLAVA